MGRHNRDGLTDERYYNTDESGMDSLLHRMKLSSIVLRVRREIPVLAPRPTLGISRGVISKTDIIWRIVWMSPRLMLVLAIGSVSNVDFVWIYDVALLRSLVVSLVISTVGLGRECEIRSTLIVVLVVLVVIC